MAVKRITPPKPKPKPKPKIAPRAKLPPKVKPVPAQPASQPPAATASTADHSTLDLAGMQDGQAAPADVTQASTVGGPGQEGAVFSTGPSSAEMLHYQQATTYQQVYADQQIQGGGQ